MKPTWRILLTVGSFFLVLSFCFPAIAAEMKLMASVEGRFRAVAACPGFVFVGEDPRHGEGLPPCEGRNLRIYDVKDPAKPRLAATYFLPSPTRHMQVSGSKLFLATHRSSENVLGGAGSNPTLIVLDIAHPTSPVLLSYYHSDDLTRLAVRGSYADVVEFHENAFKILDISNLATIHPIGTVEKVRTAAADSRGKYAYGIVGGGRTDNSRFVVVDISNPKTASIVHEAKEEIGGSYGRAIAVSGNRAVVLWGTYSGLYAGMDIFDISKPLSPRRLGQFRFPRDYIHLMGFALRGNLAFVSWSNWVRKDETYVGMYVLDCSNPANPTVRDEILFPHENRSFIAGGQIALCGSLAFATNDDEGLQIVDISGVQEK